MLIIYGERNVRKPVGFVADACPHCREVTAFRIFKVNRVSHIYYINLGSGQNLGHERQCMVCNTHLAVDTHRYAFVRPTNIGLDDLRAITFPNLDEFYASQRELARKLAGDPAALNADERAIALRQPFAALAPIVQKKFAALILDGTMGLAMLAWIAALVLTCVIAQFVPEGPVMDYAFLIVGFGGFLSMFVVLGGGGRRYMHRKILPAIADAVRPLRPTEEELGHVVAEYKRRKLTIGKRVRTKHLMPLINAEPVAAKARRSRELAMTTD